MTITIAICTHNRAQLVCEAVESVFRFCGENLFELMVVDNASSDDTRARLAEMQKQFRFEYIFEPKLGLSNARNTAIKSTSSDFVIFLDDDGEVSATWLEGFLNVIAEHEKVGAVGGKIIARYASIPPKWLSDEGRRFYGEFDLGEAVQEVTWVPGGNSAWNVGAIREAGGFDPNLGRVGASPIMGSEESALAKRLLDDGF